MRQKLIITLSLLCLAGLAACGHSPVRLPAYARNPYDANRVRLLKLAAQHGVFFVIPNNVFRDLPVRAAGESCRKTEEAPWAAHFFSVLETIAEHPAAAGKIHVIELKRGDRTAAEISRDLDGAVTLVVSYSKSETHETIRTAGELPCSNLELIGKEMTVTHLDWPSPNSVLAALSNLPPRPKVERFRVKTDFLIWLADHLTVFRLPPDVAFEKTLDGHPLLPEVLARWSAELAAGGDQGALEYWLAEINGRSRVGSTLKFFGLRKDANLARGIEVDSDGQFARKLNGSSDPTFPFISYRADNAGFQIGSLNELNTCLLDFAGKYRSAVSILGSYDNDPDSFLYPGYSCQEDKLSTSYFFMK